MFKLLCEISLGRLLIKGSWAAAEAVLVYPIQHCSQVACRYGRLYSFWIEHKPLNGRICTLLHRDANTKRETCTEHVFLWTFCSIWSLFSFRLAEPSRTGVKRSKIELHTLSDVSFHVAKIKFKCWNNLSSSCGDRTSMYQWVVRGFFYAFIALLPCYKVNKQTQS